MSYPARPVRPTPAQRAALRRLAASQAAPSSLRRRARAVLLVATGLSGAETARRTRYTPVQVSRIRRRFVEEGVEGLRARPRPGRPRRTASRVAPVAIAMALTPAIRTRHKAPSAREVARRCGVSHGTVLRIWREHGLRRGARTMIHSDPHGAKTRLQVIGLRVDPPRSVLILHVGLAGGGRSRRSGIGMEDATAALRRAAEQRTPRRRDGDPTRLLKRLRARFRRGEIHVIVESLDPDVRRTLRRWLTWKRMVHLHAVPRGTTWPACVRAWGVVLSRRDPDHRASVTDWLKQVGRAFRSARDTGIPITWVAGTARRAGR